MQPDLNQTPTPLPQPAPSPMPQLPQQPPTPQVGPTPMPDMSGQSQNSLMTPKKSKKGLIIGVILLIVVLLGVAGYFVMQMNISSSNTSNNAATNDSSKQQASTQPTQTPDPEAADLFWAPPSSLPGWAALKSNEGEQSLQYSGTSCTILFSQPDGMKKDNVASSEQLVDENIASLAKILGTTTSEASVITRAPIKIYTTLSKKVDRVTFKVKEATFEKQGRKALAASYLNGDFALSLISNCTTSDYDKYLTTAIIPLFESYKAEFTDK